MRSARAAMLASAPVLGLLADLSGWPGTVLASHESASQPFHQLTFVADLGLVAGDPGVDARAQVDEVRAWVAAAGFALLYDERYPFATAPGYHAVFCEDPDRIKLEVVAPRES